MSYLNDFKRMAEGRAMPALTESSEPRDEKALADSLEKALVDALKKSAKYWNHLRIEIDASDSNDPQDAQPMDFEVAIDAYYPEITIDEDTIFGVMHFANAKGNTGKILRATEPSDISPLLTDEGLEDFESEAQDDFERVMKKYVPGILKDAFPKYDVKNIRIGFGIQADDAVGVEWELAPKKGMKNEAAEGADVAQTILKQMGGAGRIKTMIGAKNFVSSGNSVMFQFPNPNRIANKVRITLDPSDTYTMEFYKGTSADPVKSFEGLQASDLRKTFEQFTKLYLSLGTMGGAMEGVERDSVTARMRALVSEGVGANSIYQSFLSKADAEFLDLVAAQLKSMAPQNIDEARVVQSDMSSYLKIKGRMRGGIEATGDVSMVAIKGSRATVRIALAPAGGAAKKVELDVGLDEITPASVAQTILGRMQLR